MKNNLEHRIREIKKQFKDKFVFVVLRIDQENNIVINSILSQNAWKSLGEGAEDEEEEELTGNLPPSPKINDVDTYIG